MAISSHLNRFYHGVVLAQLKKADELVIDDLSFKFRPRPLGMDSFKQLLKALDLNYPIENDVKKSTAKCEPKEICAHIEWCEKVASDSGYELQYIADEWERLKAQAYFVKGK